MNVINHEEGSMVNHRIKIAGCLLLIFFASCKSYMNETQLREYLKDPENGLMQEKKVEDIKLQAQYKPVDLVIFQDKSADSLQKENYRKHCYFILNLSKDNRELEASHVSDMNAFSNNVRQMSFGMNDLASIITDKKDTISLKDYAYPRMFGGTGTSSFILVFDNEKLRKVDGFDLYVNYPELDISREKFTFKTEDIENIPQLRF